MMRDDSLRQPFSFGKIELPSNIFCAPLAGCSDLPFRRMTSRYRPGLVFCEMVKMEALVRHDPNTYRLLDYMPDMHPIGAQLCGSKLAIARVAARIIEDLGFDVIDLNCGCPVDKVTKDGSGSGLLKNPEIIGEILSYIVNAVKIPVSVKIRAGWDEESINAPKIAKIAEQAGATAITIHGRTREQGYKGPANWDYIRDCKRDVSKILIIGNGDIFDLTSAQKIFQYTDCDGILIARGTLGQPWIIEDILRSLSGLDKLERTFLDLYDALLTHFSFIVEYQSDKQALFDMRRVGCWYLKPCIGAKSLRMQINQASSTEAVFRMLREFDWTSLQLLEQVQSSDCNLS